MKGETLTITIHMEDGRPVRAADFADHMRATIKALRATDKNLNGRVMTEWYLTGFDLQSNGVAYRITGLPKGAGARITSVNQDAPPMVNPSEVTA